MDNDKPVYQSEYEKFIQAYVSGTTTAEAVGVMVMHMAQYYSQYNVLYATRLNTFNQTARSFEEKRDESTGKSISSTKAKSLADATEESCALNYAKVHVANIEQMLNALKALQRGIMVEWNQGNNI